MSNNVNNSDIEILPLPRRRLVVIPPDNEDIDLLICVLGFESRCVEIPKLFESHNCQKICLKFQDRQIHSFKKNLEYYKKSKFEILDFHDESTVLDCISRARELSKIKANEEKGIHVAIDVSSMTRRMLAYFISYFSQEKEIEQHILLSFYYVQGEFQMPPRGLPAVAYSGPVIDDYAGWTEYPEDPNFLIMGLGYEFNRAIGANEYLDVSGAWLLLPLDKKHEFSEEVRKVNKPLIDSISPSSVMDYRVEDAYDTFIILRSLVEDLSERGKLIMLPFGPKILNAIMLVVAEQYYPVTCVWRISGGEADEAKDVNPSDSEPVVFCVRFD